MKIRIRLTRIILPFLVFMGLALLIEIPLSYTDIFGESVVLWDTLIMAVVTTPIFIYFYNEDKPFRFGMRFRVPEVIAWAAGGVVLALFLTIIIDNLGFYGTDAAEDTLFVGPMWLEAIVLLIASPVMEDLFFRGIMYGRLKELLPNIIAAVVSSLLFGIYHGNLAQGIYGFILGLYLCLVMEKTQTVAAPIAVHIAINGLSLVMSL